jgi:hypothetical protein
MLPFQTYKLPEDKNPLHQTRNYSLNNINSFLKKIEFFCRNTTYSENVNESFNKFNDDINLIHNDCFPVKTISKIKCPVKKVSKPWINFSIISSIKEKNRLYKRYLTTHNFDDYLLFVKYRNYLRKKLRILENNYFQQQLQYANVDSKKMWSLIKNIIGKTNKKETNISFLIQDNKKIETSYEMANIANNFFANIASKINLPRNKECPNVNFKSSMNPMYFYDTTPDEIFNLLMHTNKNSDLISFHLPINLIHCIAHFICVPLSQLINLTLKQGIFPCKLKNSLIIPVFKSNEKFYIEFFISLLPFIALVYCLFFLKFMKNV